MALNVSKKSKQRINKNRKTRKVGSGPGCSKPTGAQTQTQTRPPCPRPQPIPQSAIDNFVFIYNHYVSENVRQLLREIKKLFESSPFGETYKRNDPRYVTPLLQMEPLFDNISDTTAKSYVDFMNKLETMIGDTCRILTEDDFEKIKEEAKGVAFIINGFTIKVGDVSNRVKSNYDIIKVDKELDEIKIGFSTKFVFQSILNKMTSEQSTNDCKALKLQIQGIVNNDKNPTHENVLDFIKAVEKCIGKKEINDVKNEIIVKLKKIINTEEREELKKLQKIKKHIEKSHGELNDKLRQGNLEKQELQKELDELKILNEEYKEELDRHTRTYELKGALVGDVQVIDDEEDDDVCEIQGALEGDVKITDDAIHNRNKKGLQKKSTRGVSKKTWTRKNPRKKSKQNNGELEKMQLQYEKIKNTADALQDQLDKKSEKSKETLEMLRRRREMQKEDMSGYNERRRVEEAQNKLKGKKENHELSADEAASNPVRCKDTKLPPPIEYIRDNDWEDYQEPISKSVYSSNPELDDIFTKEEQDKIRRNRILNMKKKIKGPIANNEIFVPDELRGGKKRRQIKSHYRRKTVKKLRSKS